MVEEQLIRRGVSDGNVLAAFRRVERHKFVSQELRKRAYDDSPLPIACEQTISQPYMVAMMTQCLQPGKNGRVLEVGTGSGYQTAILAELCGEVYSVERLSVLAESAGKLLTELGYRNIHIKVGDGTLGWEEFSPYEGIIITAGAPAVPPTVIKQLKEDGTIVIPVGGQPSQILTVGRKHGGTIIMNEVCGCVFVPLIGQEGWNEGSNGL
jgi:protein-L-isoaspartate(D-aspartate) O-methyltransferase